MKKGKTEMNERKGNECLELVSVIRIFKHYIYIEREREMMN